MTDPTAFPIRRNTFLLASAFAVNSAAIQLVAAVSSLTFVVVTGYEGLLGLGPAIFLTSAALIAVPAGRAMDRFGRVPVLAAGFACGILGGLATGLGARTTAAPVVILGFALFGFASGTAVLSRTAGGDMYPPERRGRGIALVLFGAVFGAILGPAVFGPLFAGKDLVPKDLMLPWFAAAGLEAAGLALVVCVRPDPRRIAELYAPPRAHDAPKPEAAPLAEILRRPGVLPALVAALASFAVMVSVMNLAGYVVVGHHHHGQSSVFPIIGAHVVGMYALVLVVGDVVDRLGRRPVLVGGLLVMGASCAGLVWGESVGVTAFLLFGLGLGWNLSWVAAAAEMVDRTAPHERGRLLGFSDLLGALTGAGLALLGGYALEALGVLALSFGAAALAIAPALWIARGGVPRPDRPLATISGR